MPSPEPVASSDPKAATHPQGRQQPNIDGQPRRNSGLTLFTPEQQSSSAQSSASKHFLTARSSRTSIQFTGTGRGEDHASGKRTPFGTSDAVEPRDDGGRSQIPADMIDIASGDEDEDREVTPNSRSFDGIDRGSTVPFLERFTTVVYSSSLGRYCQIDCPLCHANSRRNGHFFNKALGLNYHITTHKEGTPRYRRDQRFISKTAKENNECIVHIYSEEDGQRMKNGQHPLTHVPEKRRRPKLLKCASGSDSEDTATVITPPGARRGPVTRGNANAVIPAPELAPVSGMPASETATNAPNARGPSEGLMPETPSSVSILRSSIQSESGVEVSSVVTGSGGIMENKQPLMSLDGNRHNPQESYTHDSWHITPFWNGSGMNEVSTGSATSRPSTSSPGFGVPPAASTSTQILAQNPLPANAGTSNQSLTTATSTASAKARPRFSVGGSGPSQSLSGRNGFSSKLRSHVAPSASKRSGLRPPTESEDSLNDRQ